MVLGGEQQVFEAAFLGQLRPGGGAELDRIEGLVGVPVLLLADRGSAQVKSSWLQAASPSLSGQLS